MTIALIGELDKRSFSRMMGQGSGKGQLHCVREASEKDKVNILKYGPPC